MTPQTGEWIVATRVALTPSAVVITLENGDQVRYRLEPDSVLDLPREPQPPLRLRVVPPLTTDREHGARE